MTTFQKTPECRINCGGSAPPPPKHDPDATMLYYCGLAHSGNCPAVRSADRARRKHRRHRFGLWRRSRRQHRLRAEAMAVMLEYPNSVRIYPEGAADRIRRRAEEISFDETLYRSLRQHAPIKEALDQYLNAVLPFTPRLPKDAGCGNKPADVPGRTGDTSKNNRSFNVLESPDSAQEEEPR